MNYIETIRKDENPKILVVTPLLPEHKVSKITKKTLKRNKTPLVWITSKGKNNIPTNAKEGINWYKKSFGLLPEYYIMIDNDIEAGRFMLDRMYERLKKAPEIVGYTYANFEFKGYVNRSFPAKTWDINKLVQANYISSNSMFKMRTIESVGLVTDDKYKRLLDWAFLLKCFRYGWIGVPCSNANFIAYSKKEDVSAGSNQDYKLKHLRVYEDFVKPLIKED